MNQKAKQALALEQFIGTDTCTYCALETECLSISEDLQACEDCIRNAFSEYWGDDEGLRIKGNEQS